MSEHRLANALQAMLLVATLAGLLALLAWIVGGGALALFALGMVVVLYLANPAASPRLVTMLYPGRLLHRRHEALRLQDEDGGPRALQQVLGGGADEEPGLAGPAQGG